MNSLPLISVIVPAYNVEKYLDRCMDSIVNQTYANLEIILVDDGATDSTPSLCDEWSRKDSRVKVIHKQNQGLGEARNSGLEIATGEYVAFVDSDDWIEIGMYQRLMDEVQQENADIVYCGHHYQKEDKTWIDRNDVLHKTVWPKSELKEISKRFIPGVSRYPFTMAVWHALYRRDVIQTRFFSERVVVSEDLHFQISAILNSSCIVYIPVALYFYAYNSGSLSHTMNFNKFYSFQNLKKAIAEVYGGEEGEELGNRFYVNTATWIRRALIIDDSKSRKEIKEYLGMMGNDTVLGVALDNYRKNRYEKIFYPLFRNLPKSLLYPLVWLDYWGVCKKFKFNS